MCRRLEKYRSERKKRSREKKEQGLKGQGAKEQNLRGHNTKEQGTKQLKSPTGTRVVQKNALYVTGLPPSIINIDVIFSMFAYNRV